MNGVQHVAFSFLLTRTQDPAIRAKKKKKRKEKKRKGKRKKKIV